MRREEFLERLHEVFEADPGSITGDDRLQQIPGWDSLTFLGLIAMVDERCGVSLEPRQVLACQSVDDLFRLIAATSERQAA